MRVLYLTTLYPAYIRQFYGINATLELEPYAVQLARLDEHAFAWVGAWRPGLEPLGYEVHEILCNVAPLQRTWAWENDRGLLGGLDELNAIAVEQVRRLQPEVVLADQYDVELLRRIRQAVPKLRLLLGWMGGTPFESEIWREFDVVLSCAPESLTWLRARGVRAEHLQHGFNDRVLAHVKPRPKTIDAAFFGQIVTQSAFHRARARFFEALIDAGIELRIHTPSYELGARDDAFALARAGVWHAVRGLRAIGAPESLLHGTPLLHRAARWGERPGTPLSRKLKNHLRPAVYGLDMFQAIAESHITLNAHADSSISYASNMRLFETTGVGGCLLTDWRDNIPELFAPEREIVTYRSAEECVEKIRWLLAEPERAAAIGRAAQSRTLRDHTYVRRAERLDKAIRGALA